MMFEKNVPWDDPSWLEEDELIHDVIDLTETEITSEKYEIELQSFQYESSKVIKSGIIPPEPHKNDHNQNIPVKNFRNKRNNNNNRRPKQIFPNNHNQEGDRMTNNRNKVIEKNKTSDNQKAIEKEELDNTNESLKRPPVAIYNVHSVKGKWSNAFSDENNKSMLIDQKAKNFNDRMSKKPNYIPKETSYNQNQFTEDQYQNFRKNPGYSLEQDRGKEDKNRSSTNSSVAKIRENSSTVDDKSLIDEYHRFQNKYNTDNQELIRIERTVVNDNYDKDSSNSRFNHQNQTKNDHFKSPKENYQHNNKRNTNEKRDDNLRDRRNPYNDNNVPNDRMRDLKLNDKPFPENKEFKHPYDRRAGNKTDFTMKNGDGNNLRINKPKENNDTDNNVRRQHDDRTMNQRNHFRNSRNGTYEIREDSHASPTKNARNNEFQYRNRNYNNESTVENETMNKDSRRNVRDRLGQRNNSNTCNNNTSRIRSNNRDQVQ